jgi:hypothetical protein
MSAGFSRETAALFQGRVGRPNTGARPSFSAKADAVRSPSHELNGLRAFPLLMEPEAELYDFDLTHFLHANWYALRSKTL